MRGPVTKVEWVNPHAWIHLRIEKEDGTEEDWMVEAGTPIPAPSSLEETMAF